MTRNKIIKFSVILIILITIIILVSYIAGDKVIVNEDESILISFDEINLNEDSIIQKLSEVFPNENIELNFDEKVLDKIIDSAKSYKIATSGLKIEELPNEEHLFFLVQKQKYTIVPSIENILTELYSNVFFYNIEDKYHISKEYDIYPIGPADNPEYNNRLNSTYRNDLYSFNLFEGNPVVNYPNIAYLFKNEAEQSLYYVNRIRHSLFKDEVEIKEIRFENQIKTFANIKELITSDNLYTVPSLDVYLWSDLFIQRYPENSLSNVELYIQDPKSAYYLIVEDRALVPVILFNLRIKSNLEKINGENIEVFLPLIEKF